jgi:hypothetical protein
MQQNQTNSPYFFCLFIVTRLIQTLKMGAEWALGGKSKVAAIVAFASEGFSSFFS